MSCSAICLFEMFHYKKHIFVDAKTDTVYRSAGNVMVNKTAMVARTKKSVEMLRVIYREHVVQMSTHAVMGVVFW